MSFFFKVFVFSYILLSPILILAFKNESSVTCVRFPCSVTLALLQQCTSTTLLHSLDTQQYWTTLASLADNNVIKQHCYARNNRQAFPRSQDCCLRTSTDIFCVS
jgi:hypothetical protein